MALIDVQLRQNVLDELEFEPSVNAAHIGVAADNGVITLTGHVASYAEKISAEQATRRVKGVRAIAQEIKVRYPGEKKATDEDIASRAVNILRWSAVVPADQVQVKVQDGWATLMGQVDWQFQKTAAESELRKLSGISGISNSITIKPRVEAQDVKRKIEDALKRSAEIEAQGINVSVLGDGKIALDGKVHDWGERYAVERAAWSVPGVRTVEDRLTIN